ncbi:MAG: NosD domain-containing protein [Candidatus ainarchaeum sp.]|nr:NosD domain-containing protein [Candidatus ainarchaeum sp.]
MRFEAFIMLLGLLLLPSLSFAIDCTCDSCNSCNSALQSSNCTTIRVTADISASSDCITFSQGTSGKTLDCQSHAIIGSGTSTGITIYRSDRNTVRRCSVRDFGTGLLLDHSDSNTVSRITASGCNTGISLISSDSNELSSLNATNNTYGIKIDSGSSDNRLVDTVACGNDLYSGYDFYDHSIYNNETDTTCDLAYPDGVCTRSCAALSCEDECTANETRCEGNRMQKCIYDNDLCTRWANWQTCALGEACSNGACISTCQDECAQSQTRCAGDRVQTCVRITTCYSWNTLAVNCPSGQTCINDSCRFACAGECTPNQTRCDGANLEICVQSSSTGCYFWNPQNCAPGQACSNGTCIQVCRGEGEVVSQDEQCCPGLQQIPSKSAPYQELFCTAKCGDGICDNQTESEYNCPADCFLKAPTVELLFPPDGASLYSPVALVFGAEGSSGLTCFATINNSVYGNRTVLNGTNSTLFDSLQPGAYSWNVSCTDANGVAGVSSTREFNVLSKNLLDQLGALLDSIVSWFTCLFDSSCK